MKNMNHALTGAPLERRNRGIATNAVQEARKALARDHLPITDDEAARIEMVYRILSSMNAQGAADDDAGLIVATRQPELSKPLVNVERLLSDLDIDDTPVRAPSRLKPTAVDAIETK